MNQRILYWLTALVIVGMLILLSINLTSILKGEPDNQTYLKFNNVRGMAVGYQKLLYTLNFKQQNAVINILNRAVQIVNFKQEESQKPDIDKIIVYQFAGQPEITIQPIAYVNQNLVFSAPDWEPNQYFMELSSGNLKQLLSETYDHQ